MTKTVALLPCEEDKCAVCGEIIGFHPGESFMASTDGKVWHMGCAPSRNTRTQTDQQLREEVERLREAFTALDRIVSENIVETGEPDRVRWKGVWYDGPLATAYLTTLRVIQKLARLSLSSSSLTK